jgi:vacuolar-type H+-ATPase subunit I/STV1
MRALDKTKNYSILASLIEEVQTMVNRMEARLYDVKDWEEYQEEIRKLKRKKKKLERQVAQLEETLE